MENHRIDEHKLIYHPKRVVEWLDSGDCYPIYVEVSPSGKCNHRCIFCALNYMSYEAPFLEGSLLEQRLKEMSCLGVRAIMLAGEGEPLLHPDIGHIVQVSWSAGLDVSITTNGVFLDRIFDVVDKLSWVRVSLDASSAKTYSEIHGCSPVDFSKVISNLEQLVHLKKERHLKCTIGTQLLLLEDNYKEAEELSLFLGEMGVDYFSIKPYSPHPLSTSRAVPITDNTELLLLEEKVKLSETRTRQKGNNNFQASFRREAFSRVGIKKRYNKCLGSSFFCHLTSLGEIYSCSTFLGKPEFSYGNIYERPFKEIWKGERRQRIMQEVDVSTCRENCRLDPINNYLWKLKHSPAHVNFI